jgi:hypothetical protein
LGGFFTQPQDTYWAELGELYLGPYASHFEVKGVMPKKVPPDEKPLEFGKIMSEMATARLDLFRANAPKYAEALGVFRAALKKSGFSDDESMQIVLKSMEQPRRPMFWGGHGGPWHRKR